MDWMARILDPNAWTKLCQSLGIGIAGASSSSGLLQPSDMPKQISEHVYEIFNKRQKLWSAEIVFFHGLELETSSEPHISTWLSRDKKELWLNWLQKEFPDVRILTVRYDASLVKKNDQGRVDSYLTSENLLVELTGERGGSVGGAECPIILVGHCLGGLVLKALLIMAVHRSGLQQDNDPVNRFLSNVKGIFCYASPHHGSELPDCSTQYPRGSLFEDLTPLNTETGRRNFEFEPLKRNRKWKSFGVGESRQVTLSGFTGLIVPEASSRHGVDVGRYYTADADHFNVCRPEDTRSRTFTLLVELIDAVIEKEERSMPLPRQLPENRVGLRSSIGAIQKELQTERRIAITGMWGVGKTTLALAVYNRIGKEYEYSCFLQEVKCCMRGAGTTHELREEIKKRLVRRSGASVGEGFNWNELAGKKVLIILDDVESAVQLEVMTESDKFSSESRVIITTRDKSFISEIDRGASDKGSKKKRGTHLRFHIHKLQNLRHEDAKELFCLCAFGKKEPPSRPPEGPRGYLDCIVKKCEGLPLALTILGKYLSKHPEANVWKDVYDRFCNAKPLTGTKQDGLWSLVMPSYESLCDDEREMFLDAATCFHGELLEKVQRVWRVYRREPSVGWNNLLELHLVREERRRWDRGARVYVHEALRCLGSREAGYSRISAHNLHMVPKLSDEEAKKVKILKGSIKDFPDKFTKLTELEVLWVGEYVRVSDPESNRDSDPESNCDSDPGSDRDSDPGSDCDSDPESDCDSDSESDRDSNQNREDEGHNKSDHDSNRESDHEDDDEGNHQSAYERNHKSNTDDGSDVEDGESDMDVGSDWDDFIDMDDMRHLYSRRYSDDGSDSDEGSESDDGSLDGFVFRRLVFATAGFVTKSSQLNSIFGSKSLQCLILDWNGHSVFRNTNCVELGNLQEIWHLELTPCKGKALPHICRLQNLEYLKVSYTTWAIPENISKLNRLISLTVIGSSQAIPEGICDLKRLESLTIIGCNSLQAIPEGIGKLRTLQSLTLSVCGRLKAIPEGIGKLHTLQSFTIFQCNSLEAIPEGIGKLQTLQSFTIFQCNSLEAIPEGIGKLRTLQSLKISSCRRLETIRGNIGGLKSLEALEIFYCDRLRAIPEGINKLRRLKCFKILACDSLEAIPEEVGRLKKLKKFYISHCAKLRAIPEGIGELEELKEFKILHCGKLRAIPEGIGKLKGLQSLKISDCQDLETIPEGICKLEGLRSLEIVGCYRLEVIPEEFGGLVNLEVLNISDCSGLRAILRGIDKLQRLTSLRFPIYDTPEVTLARVDQPQKTLQFSQFLDTSCCKNLMAILPEIGKLRRLKSIEIGHYVKLTANGKTEDGLGSPYSLDLPGGYDKGGILAELDKLQNSNLNISYRLRLVGITASHFGLVRIDLNRERDLVHPPVEITIESCGNLEVILGVGDYLDAMSKLRSLTISGCYNLEVIPPEICYLFELQFLKVSDCHKLREIPLVEIFHTSYLQSLTLSGCPKLGVIHGGLDFKLPCRTSLRSLDISGCPKLVIPEKALEELRRSGCIISWPDRCC